MGYAEISLDDVDQHELDDIEPDVLPIGVELRPSEIRPSIWLYEAGESSNRHYQAEQEELYAPLSGQFEVEIVEQDDEAEPEIVDLEPDDYLVVDPDTVRQLTAVSDGHILVVGAPNVKDDGVVVE